jgi:CheY-like chemotaxis protein
MVLEELISRMKNAPLQTVLIVDDDPFLRAFAVAVLEDAGYLTRQANTAVEGIVAAMQTQPDLILLDYAMPRNDGINVLEGLSGIEELGSTPVIVLSASQSDDVRMRMQALGATWLSKPVTPADLLSAVKRRLES